MKNSSFHDRSKHIDAIYLFIRNVIERGDIYVAKISTLCNPADGLTKPLNLEKTKFCFGSIGCEDKVSGI